MEDTAWRCLAAAWLRMAVNGQARYCDARRIGVYYDQHSAGIVESGLSQPPYSTGNFIQGTANGPVTLQSPYVPLVLPNSAYPIFVTRSAASPLPFTQGTDPNIKDAQTLEYNLNFQYAPGRDWVAQVGYVGTRSVHHRGKSKLTSRCWPVRRIRSTERQPTRSIM